MKVSILAFISLIFSVNSGNAKRVPTVLESLYPLYHDTYYYGSQGNLGSADKRPYKLENKTKLDNRPRPPPIIVHNFGYRKEDEYKERKPIRVQPEEEDIGYYPGYPENRRFYGDKPLYQYRLIGRVGLGFDKRTATATSYLSPITPKLLELVGSRPYQPYNNGYNYQNLNLHNYLHSSKHDNRP